ncbi:MAG: MBL fold metallo-hydrolase [Candidatus Andersenbacteria bacterium]|nr:MBL fold metallo-hydrolase [Candidatus Andersenbacteria bacterium]MBI3251140.1 MBL fold metallo-hydrolase [Candidatus Andersenbacteria bacterium]
MNSPTITFYGAAGGVTGSKHLVQGNKSRILLDCGIFQGLPDVRERNRSFPFAPDSIDAVVLSHAHLDHTGMLPLLVKRGFAGKIYATPATRDIVEYMLADTAKIEVQDAEYRARHHLGSPDERIPLFDAEDIPPVMDRFMPIPYARKDPSWHEVGSNVRMKFYDAGHILGSAVTVLEVDGKIVAYTGDLGPNSIPLLHDPEVPEEEITTLLMEATYGKREHDNLDGAITNLAAAINRICERGGKMLVPAFSLGRTQTIVYIIHKLVDEGRIPRFPMYVDSPLASHITEVHKHHHDLFDKETTEDFGDDHKPLTFRNLTYTESVDESKKLNSMDGPLMIISAAGMMTGGRVVHHARQIISDKKNAVIITGFQAGGTPGRQLVEGAPEIELLGERLPVTAEILVLNEFSAHADRRQLLTYAQKIKGLQSISLVHSESEQATALKQYMEAEIPELAVTIPSEGDTISL